MCQVETISQEFHLGPGHEWQRPMYLSHNLLVLTVHYQEQTNSIDRRLNQISITPLLVLLILNGELDYLKLGVFTSKCMTLDILFMLSVLEHFMLNTNDNLLIDY